MRYLRIGVTVVIGIMMTVGVSVQAEPPRASVSLDHGVRFTAPDGSAVAVSAGTYRLEAVGDNQLRLRSDGQTESPLLKAFPLSSDIPIDTPSALYIPDEPDVSHPMLALSGGKGYDARTWSSEVSSRSVSEEPIAREKLNAALAALVGSSSSGSAPVLPAETSGTVTLETAAGVLAGSDVPSNENEIESRGGLPFLQRSDGINGTDLSVSVSGKFEFLKRVSRDGSDSSTWISSYLVDVKNLGDEAAYDVRILLTVIGPDTWGRALDYAAYTYHQDGKTSGLVSSCGKTKIQEKYVVLTCTLPVLERGGRVTAILNTNYDQSAQTPPFPGFAQVSSATPDPNPDNNRASTSTYLAAPYPAVTPTTEMLADLDMSLTGTVDAAKQLQAYRLTVTNRGSVLAEDVTFTHMFTRPLPGPNVLRIDINGANTTCESRSAAVHILVITCKAAAIPAGGVTGATIRYLNPGNQSWTSTAQVISPVPDLNRGNNAVTITVPTSASKAAMVPRKDAPSPQATSPPTTTAPPAMTLLPPSAAMGIIKPAPVQIQPQTTAPATQTSPAPHTGKYRVVISGLRVNHETRDDMWQRDGKRDEVYVAAFVRLQSGPYTDPITGRNTFELHNHGFVKSMVHGDVNGIGNRIQAGTASDLGGIRTGDIVPSGQDPAVPSSRPPSTTTFPVNVWEGTLDNGKILRIHPTLWEWDGETGIYNHWQVSMEDAYINHAASSDYNSVDQVLSQGNVMVIDNVSGHDHPIGMSYYYVNNDKSKLRVYEPIITLTQRKLEALFSSPSVIGGVPPVVIPVEFMDVGDELEGNYTMYLRVERLQ